MTALLPDKAWLHDTVTIELYTDEGDYNKPNYAEAIELTNVRVDMTKEFSGTGSNRTLTANATVFLIAAYTTNYPVQIDDSWLQARLTYNGHEYKVVNWSAYQEPDSSAPYSIELQVI
jgi:hypothetical protein